MMPFHNYLTQILSLPARRHRLARSCMTPTVPPWKPDRLDIGFHGTFVVCISSRDPSITERSKNDHLEEQRFLRRGHFPKQIGYVPVLPLDHSMARVENPDSLLKSFS